MTKAVYEQIYVSQKTKSRLLDLSHWAPQIKTRLMFYLAVLLVVWRKNLSVLPPATDTQHTMGPIHMTRMLHMLFIVQLFGDNGPHLIISVSFISLHLFSYKNQSKQIIRFPILSHDLCSTRRTKNERSEIS